MSSQIHRLEPNPPVGWCWGLWDVISIRGGREGGASLTHGKQPPTSL